MRARIVAVGMCALGLLACDVDVHTDRETAREVDEVENTFEGAGRDLDEAAREAGRDVGRGLERAGEEVEDAMGGSGDEPWDEKPDTPVRER